MPNLGLILARSGSVGVEKKNLRLVGDESLLERAIKVCLESNFDKLIVSSNDSETLNLASKYPVTLHKRSEMTSKANSTSESACLEVLNDMGYSLATSGTLSLIQATSPFILAESITQCVQNASKGFSSFTATLDHTFRWKKVGDLWDPISHDPLFRPRRQDLNESVRESGACYSFPIPEFLKIGSRFCSSILPVITSSKFSVEVDKEEDLEWANILNAEWNNYKREREI
jgi:CMP-N-acetylneuraminic acid synthetase